MHYLTAKLLENPSALKSVEEAIEMRLEWEKNEAHNRPKK